MFWNYEEDFQTTNRIERLTDAQCLLSTFVANSFRGTAISGGAFFANLA